MYALVPDEYEVANMIAERILGVIIGIIGSVGLTYLPCILLKFIKQKRESSYAGKCVIKRRDNKALLEEVTSHKSFRVL